MKQFFKDLFGISVLEEKVKNRDAKIKEYEEELNRVREQWSSSYEDLKERYDELLEAYNKLTDSHRKDENEKTQVILYIDNNDVSKINPVTRINPNVVDTLVEEGYLNSAHYEDHFAQHLALILLASEAMDYIITEYEQVKGDESLFQD